MKRQSTKTKNEIFSCNPWFFWKECMFCKQEFRREKGYRFQLTRNADWDYACSDCCSSNHDCDMRIEEFKQINTTPETRQLEKVTGESAGFLVIVVKTQHH